jgi:hypothetical protein
MKNETKTAQDVTDALMAESTALISAADALAKTVEGDSVALGRMVDALERSVCGMAYGPSRDTWRRFADVLAMYR